LLAAVPDGETRRDEGAIGSPEQAFPRNEDRDGVEGLDALVEESLGEHMEIVGRWHYDFPNSALSAGSRKG
jgi:hypothetical protein